MADAVVCGIAYATVNPDRTDTLRRSVRIGKISRRIETQGIKEDKVGIGAGSDSAPLFQAEYGGRQ